MQDDAPTLRRFEVDVGGQYVGFLPAGFVGCFYFFDQAVYCAKQVVGHVQIHKWKFLGKPPIGFKPAGGLILKSPQSIDIYYLTKISSEPDEGWGTR